MGFIFALFYPFLIIIYALLAGALIASLIVFINNMRNGVANRWPTKNLVGAIIAGIIFVMAFRCHCFDGDESIERRNKAYDVRTCSWTR